MKVETIDSHLNRCLTEPPPPRLAITSGPSNIHPGTHLMQKPPKKPDQLPHLNYSLFKDSALRKKLQELGVSAQGSRPLLEKRHTEWVTLWNSNCDSSRPRKKIDLLRELDVWERTQGVPSSSSAINPAGHLLHKDFDSPGWATKHDLSFQNLIASARRNLEGVKRKPVEISDIGPGDGEASEESLATSVMPLGSHRQNQE